MEHVRIRPSAYWYLVAVVVTLSATHPDREGAETVLTVYDDDVLGAMFRAIGGALLAALGVPLLAIVIAIVTAVRRGAAKREAELAVRTAAPAVGAAGNPYAPPQ